MLQALAQVLKSHIAVYTVGMPVQDLGEEYKGGWLVVVFCCCVAVLSVSSMSLVIVHVCRERTHAAAVLPAARIRPGGAL